MDARADVIVIGGGVAGLSTALQLARRGAAVLVLERTEIGSGSTSRAAGLVGQLRGTAEHTRMLMESVRVVRALEQETGRQIFDQSGSLRLAATPQRAQELADLVAMGKSIGFEIDHVPIHRVQSIWPSMRTDDLLDACHCPTDGNIQPSELVAAFVQVGRQYGVRYVTRSPVEEILTQGGRVHGVRSGRQEFLAPVLVNAAGPWSYLLADQVDAPLPASAMMHYRITVWPEASPRIDPRGPAIRDRHTRIYARPGEGGLIVGMYDTVAHRCEMRQLAADFDMASMLPPDRGIQVARVIQTAQQRFPWIHERLPIQATPGIMTFSPDGLPLCGQLPGTAGLYYCTAFCGHGIAQSPMIGVIMAELILDGRCSYDLAAIEADRFFDLPGYQSRREIEDRCQQMYVGYYGRVEGGQDAD